MTATPSDWRVRVRAGDTLSISATYETRRASRYESMGIMVVYMTYDSDGKGSAAGVNPFGPAPRSERSHHARPSRREQPSRWIAVAGHKRAQLPGLLHKPGEHQELPLPARRLQGDRREPLRADRPTRPVADLHQPRRQRLQGPGAGLLSFLSPSAAYRNSAFHTITSCQNPCGLDTGISYPLANGPGNYDSAELGVGTPAASRVTWSTPTGLKPGTYTFYCRIHPFMRGTFRVVHA